MVRGEDRAREPAAEEELAEFAVDEAGIGVLRETSLDWLEVNEFGGAGADRRKEGEGQAGGDQGLADASVGAPYHVNRVGERVVYRGR